MDEELPTQLIIWLYHQENTGGYAVFTEEPTPTEHQYALVNGCTGPFKGTLALEDYKHRMQ